MANWKRWWGMIWNGNKRGDGIRRVGSWLVLGGCLDRWFELWLPCKRNISRPPFAQHSRYALGLSFCPARLPTSRCRQRAAALVRGVEAVPVASQPPCHRWFVDWRDGFISPWRWNWKKKNDVSESSKIAPTRNWRWFFSLYITWRSQQITVCKNLERLQTSSLFRWKNTLLHYQPTPGGGRRAPKETPPWFSLAILLGTPQFHRRDGKKGQKVSILGAHLRLMSI